MTATKIDRLALSIKDDSGTVQRFLSGMYAHVGKPAYEFRHGGHGFKHSALVTVGGAQVAWWGFGGASQKGRCYVDLSGLGCQLIEDWQSAQGAIEGLPGVKAKRIDIAADFYRGEVSYEDAVAAYHGGKFNRAGRPPKMTQILGSEGRTLYVGARGNDVYFRAYEKGRKEFSGVPHDGRVRFDDWVRLELELRAVKRPLDWNVIAQRDQYFAGAYPYLQEVMPHVEPQVLVTPERIAEADLAKSLKLIRDQWGSTLYTALTVCQGDVCAVMSQIVGSHHNERLVAAGALLFAEAHPLKTDAALHPERVCH